MSNIIATFFFVGRLRPAPGTWGSAVAVPFGVAFHYLGSFPLLAMATLAAAGWGFWACERELRDTPGEDPSEIVIDEVAGQWLALAFPSFAFWIAGFDNTTFPWPAWVGAFLLFRLFDIWKPSLVGKADARHDPVGVMLDDIWAGVFAGIAVLVLGVLWHVPLMMQ